MSLLYIDNEHHLVKRSSWLRATFLGVSEGIIVLSSLIIGMVFANVSYHFMLAVSFIAVISGAVETAARKYFSYSYKYNSESADLDRQNTKLHDHPTVETDKLTDIYIDRGVNEIVAGEVARQLIKQDASHRRAFEEFGLSDINPAFPLRTAFVAAGMFVLGGLWPLLILIFCRMELLIPIISIASLFILGISSMITNKLEGVNVRKSLVYVIFWRSLAMCVAACVGFIFKQNL